MKLTPIEKRVLAYLEQRGPTHRSTAVGDLAETDRSERWGISPQAAALIMGSWCKRLKKAGLVSVVHEPSRLRTRGGGTKTLRFYTHHAITDAGRAALRDAAEE